MINKMVILLGICLLLFNSPLSAADYQFVGSKNSNKYHYTSCRWAQKIYSENLVTFESVKDAKNNNYVACKVCKPPA